MYEAGSAAVLLGFRLNRTGLLDFLKDVERAKKEKGQEYQIVTKADTGPLTRFRDALLGTRDAALELNASVDRSMVGVDTSVSKATSKVDTSLGVMSDAAKKTSKSILGISESSKQMANVVADESSRSARGMATMAKESTAAKDRIVKNNEEVIASQREITRNYMNPVGGGGGRGGGVVATGGTADNTPEGQAKKTAAAWKEGFNSLANIGKWVTFGILGVGAISVKMAADFQRQMEMVHTQAGYSQVEVDRLKKSVLDLAPAVGIGPTKLAEGLFHIASSGIPAAKAMDILKFAAEGAKVSGANLEDVTNALVAVMRTAPRDIHSAAEAIGIMNDIVGQGNLRMQDLVGALTTGILPAAKAVGLGFRDVGAALDVMTARGIPAQEGATRLRTVLGLIANPTSKAQKALDELGFAHDRLANDFRRHGLTYALQDLQTAMNNVFGRRLSQDQIRSALTAYGKQLEAAGASTNTIRKALIQYHAELEKTGEGAVKSSQLIANAFGGARMGTTMQILMQNIDDVRKHTEQLSTDNAPAKFQSAWQATQKDFSVQASQLGASIQKFGIIIGDFVIPKIRDLVNWLSQAATWMGHHKVLAEALAVVFGTVLTAAILAFFARFIKSTADGIISIAKFGKAITDIPGKAATATERYLQSASERLRSDDKEIARLKDLEVQAGVTADALTGVGEAGAVTGRGAAVAGEPSAVEGILGGAIEGMITGIVSTMAPGSRENPLAVVVLASEAFGLTKGAAAEAATSSTVLAGERQVAAEQAGLSVPAGKPRITPKIGAMAPAATAGLAEEEALLAAGGLGATGAAGSGLLSRIAGGGGKAIGMAGRFGSRLLGGLGAAGMGLLVSQTASQAIGGTAGSLIGSAGMGASAGALAGSIIPGLGTALGAAIGGALGLAVGLVGGKSESSGHKVADSLSKGFGGAARPNLQKELAAALDDAASLTKSKTTMEVSHDRFGVIRIPVNIDVSKLTGAALQRYNTDMVKAGHLIASQLEAGWNQYKFQSEPVMFTQFTALTKHLPVEAQAAAAESAVKFMQELEKQGRVASGSTQVFLNQIEERFPEFKKYMGITATASVQEFTKAFDFKKAQDSLGVVVSRLSNDFAQVRDAVDTTSGTTNDKAASMEQTLMGIINGPRSTDAMKKAATADLRALRKSISTEFSSMETTVDTTMTALVGAIKNGTAGAAQAAATNFNTFAKDVHDGVQSGVISAGQGSALIAKELVQTLKAFGDTRIPQAVINAMEWQQSAIPNPPRLSGANMPRGHAGGGMLPGSEFGTTDQMTLVDPMGRPRAKLAGDEAVFNRHQMPFVEAGLQLLGFHGAEDLWQRISMPNWMGMHARGGKMNYATGGYLYPFPANARIGRTDMGVDVNMTPGSPIGPMGDARIMGILQNWYQNQPYIWWQLLNGPRAGRFAYVAEQITNLARPGQVIHANQPVATYAGSGTGIEYGWATSTGRTLAQATTGYHEGMITPAGQDITRFLGGLAHGHILGGGALGSIAGWTNMTAPPVRGRGTVPDMARASLKMITAAANAYGQNQVGGMGLASQFAGQGGGNAANQSLGRRMMMASGWPSSQWPYLEALWNQESGWNAYAVNPSSGAYGIPQSLGHGRPYRLGDAPAQIGWGLNYIRQRYGSPQAAEAHERQFNWYDSGGWLGSFASGGSPWTPLPSGTGYVPGFRPIRVRRGRGGVHVVGGSSVSSGSHSARTTGRSGSSRSVRGVARKRQPLSQTTAAVLDSLGLGTFTNDQNVLGQLDNQYTTQESLFNMFDSTAAGLPLSDLNVLMGIREQGWDILSKEWKTLPAAISLLQSRVSELAGSPAHGATRPRTIHTHGGMGGGRHYIPGHPAHGASGMVGLEKQITGVEDDITNLQQELRVDSRKISTIHHVATGEAMSLADNLAQGIAGYTVDLSAITDQRYALAQERIGLRQQSQALTSTGSTGVVPLSTIVGSVMAGDTAPIKPSSSTNTQKKAIQRRITQLTGQESKLARASDLIHRRIKALNAQKNSEVRRLRLQGFEAAWAITVQRWGVEDKITFLKQKLAKLKALLKVEEAQLKKENVALTQITDWMTGGLQGNQSIIQSLGDVGMDILGLYQEGATLPTPGRKSPTLTDIEKVLSSAPPNGLGLTLPPGLVGGRGTVQAQQAISDFLNFQASRASLFSQFGSNFVQAGRNPFGSAAALGAGAQFYGAAAGSSAGLGVPIGPQMARGGYLSMGGSSPGATTIHNEFHNHFASGPPEPHTFAAGVRHEVGAMV